MAILGGGDPKGVTNCRETGLCTVTDEAILEVSTDHAGPALPRVEGDLAEAADLAEVEASADSTGPALLAAEGDLTEAEGDLTAVSTTRAGPLTLCTDEDLLRACDGVDVETEVVATLSAAALDEVTLPVTCSTAFATASMISSAPSVSSFQVRDRCGCAANVVWTTCVAACGCGGLGCACMTRDRRCGDGCRCSCAGEAACRCCRDVSAKGFDGAKSGCCTVYDCCVAHGNGGVVATIVFVPAGSSVIIVAADDCASILSQER